MIKISDLEKISDNLELMGYGVEKTSQVFIYRKENNRFDVDLDIQDIRFFTKSKKWKLQKTFTLPEFALESTSWIKKHKIRE